MKNLTWLCPELLITSVPTEKSNDRELSSHNWVLWVKANIFVNEAFLSYPICTTIWWLVRNSLIGMWDDYRFLDKSQMLLLTCRYLAKQIGWPMNRKYNLEIGCLTTDPQAKILNLWWGVLICCGFLLVIKWTLKLRRNWSVLASTGYLCHIALSHRKRIWHVSYQSVKTSSSKTHEIWQLLFLPFCLLPTNIQVFIYFWPSTAKSFDLSLNSQGNLISL